MEYVGYAPTWDRVVFRGDPASRAFVAFWLSRGRVAAAMSVNAGPVSGALSTLVASGERVPVRRLTDPQAPLDDLHGLAA